MFNRDLKGEAIEKLNKAIDIYKESISNTQSKSADLFVLRNTSSEEIIGMIDYYQKGLSNLPTEFDQAISAYKDEYKVFYHQLKELNANPQDIDVKFGTTETNSVLAEVESTDFLPMAIMIIATTFGSTSSRTLITSLPGFIATNTTLNALLGGSALTAEALLTFSGPVGWILGGIGLISVGLATKIKYKNITDNIINNKRKEIEALTAQLNTAYQDVDSLIALTKYDIDNIKKLLPKLKEDTPRDYLNFREQDKHNLAVLIRHIRSLSELLNKRVIL